MAREIPLFTSGSYVAGTAITEVKYLKAGEACALQLNYQDTTPAAFTFTAAATDICTAVAHGAITGLKVAASTTTTLPAPLTATNYWIVKLSADTFSLATSLANAIAVPPVVVDITDAGTGTHTLTPATGGTRTLQVSISMDGTNFVTAWQVDGAAAVTLATLNIATATAAASKLYAFPGIKNIRAVKVVTTLADGQANISGVLSIAK
jgi:hypothetical protein